MFRSSSADAVSAPIQIPAMRRARLWQEGYYDRVLRSSDATLEIARYIVANPVRARLCVDAMRYPYSGSSKYTLIEIVHSLG
jgi:hypothetical protein